MISIMSSEITGLFQDGGDRQCAQGQTLFRAGDAVQQVYLVRSGRVALLRQLPSGGQVILHKATPGDVLAEASVYARHYHCDGVALEPSRLSVMPRADFRKALRADPERAEAWAARLAHQVQNARLRAELRSLRTVTERLTAWLELGGKLPPKGQWQEVADELSVSREALYRELARRRDRG